MNKVCCFAFRRGLSLGLMVLLGTLSAFAAPRPNVVIIYGDDVGFADVGFGGSKMIPTPNIDKLASQGLVFTDGHCSSSVCSPSRFALLTGKHPLRSDGLSVIAPGGPLAINPDTFTLPDLFKKAGYITAVIGKWHLGIGPGEGRVGSADWNGEVKPGPLEIGFDYSFLIPSTNDRVPCVFLRNHRVVNYDPNDPIYLGNGPMPEKTTSTQYPVGKTNPEAMTTMKSVKGHNGSVINGIGRIGYMVGGKAALWDDFTISDVLVEEAQRFIAKQKKDKPFFLYFPSQAIHTPRTPNKRFQGKTELGPRGDSMVEFDWKVGEVMKALKKKGMLEDTIIVLSSDNGPVYIDGYEDGTTISRKTHPGEELDRGHDGSGPYRGGKYMPHDGGTRVPFVFSWPAKVKPGVSAATVGQIDLMASFATLLDIELPEDAAKDSRDLLPVFMGKSDKGVDYLLQGFKAQKALRYKNWKYIPGRRKAKQPEQLYNLDDDIGEQVNLAESNPEMTQHMRDSLQKILTSDSIREFE